MWSEVFVRSSSAQFVHWHVEVRRVDDALALELYPDAIDLRPREHHLELNHLVLVHAVGMLMDHVDHALTQEQIELIVDGIQNDGSRGNNRRALRAEPSFANAPSPAPPAPAKNVRGAMTLDRPLVLDGLLPQQVAANQSIRMIAALPDGSVEPLIWLHQYDPRYTHPFLFRKPVRLPAGTVIRGVPDDAAVGLLAH